MEWQDFKENKVLVGDMFYVSYCPSNVERGEPETALVKHIQDDECEYYILLGDWRVDYEKLVPQGYEICHQFYQKNKEFCHPLSPDFDLKNASLDEIMYNIQGAVEVLKRLKT